MGHKTQTNKLYIPYSADPLPTLNVHIKTITLKVALCAIFIAKFGLYLLYISKVCHK